MLKRKFAFLFLIATTWSLLETSWAQSSGAAPTKSAAPLATEKNPPGDIPDNQAFVDYTSPLSFSIKVPEGWARREQASNVVFSDNSDVNAVTNKAIRLDRENYNFWTVGIEKPQAKAFVEFMIFADDQYILASCG